MSLCAQIRRPHVVLSRALRARHERDRSLVNVAKHVSFRVRDKAAEINKPFKRHFSQ